MKNKCWISGEHIRILEKHARAHAENETGGLLMGYWNTSHEVVITHVSTAGPAATHSRKNYDPDMDYDAAVVRIIHSGSRGVNTYLGDWHSHPKGISRLSRTDKKAMTHISESTAAPVPLMAILAGHGEIWKIGIWKRVQTCGSLLSLYFSMEIQRY